MYAFSNEAMEQVINGMKELFDQYNHRYSDHGLNTIQSEYKANKNPLAEILSKHPNWDDKNLAIIFSYDYERKVNKGEARDFVYWMIDQLFDSFNEKEVKYAGHPFSYWDAQHYNNTGWKEREASIAMGAIKQWFFHSDEDKCFRIGHHFYNAEIAKEVNLKNEIITKLSADQVLDSLIEGKISAETAKWFNEKMPELKAKEGQKFSRLVGKIGKAFGFDKIKEIDPANGRDYGWNRRFAMFADSVNPLKITRHTILSINPLDYLLASNGYQWSSCHTIDPENENGYHGMYMSGTLSYMLDSSSMVFYTVDRAYEGKEYWRQPKMQRCMFHYQNEKLVQGRVYPDGRDGGDDSLAAQFRAVVQKILADCLEINNYWTKENSVRNYVRSFGTHYRDYVEYPDPCISFIKGSENEEKVNIGHDPICPECGHTHRTSGALNCPDCDENHIFCEHCGREIDPDDWRTVHIGDNYYCDAECAEEDGWVYTEDADWCQREDCMQDDWTGDWWYYYEDREIVTEDGYHYINEDNARQADYEQDRYGQWYSREDLHYCRYCHEFVTDDEWDEELECCTDCAEEEAKEAM